MAIRTRIKLSLILCLCFAEQIRAAEDYNGGKAQKLEFKSFTVCGHQLSLEVADDPNERTIGLMNRTSILPGKGMIFVFPHSELRQFWMRNVSFSIDIGFFNEKGILLAKHTMAGTTPMVVDEALLRYSSASPAKYAVEAGEGFFKTAKVSRCRLSPLPKTLH